MAEASPFQPGVRVAIVNYGNWSGIPTYRESRVLKVHKTGRFTLEVDPQQQWRPTYDRGFLEPRWRADAAGGHLWGRERLYIWDADMDDEVARVAQRQALNQRWNTAREKVERIRPRDATTALIEAVEAAIVAFEAPTPAGITGDLPGDAGEPA